MERGGVRGVKGPAELQVGWNERAQCLKVNEVAVILEGSFML